MVTKDYDMEVRPLKSEEAALYVALRREMLRDSPWAFGASESDDRRLDEHAIAQSVSTGLTDENYAIIGAFDDATLIGSAVLVREAKVKTRHRVDVFSVYVTPSWRGRGMGDAMLAETKRIARTWRGVDSLRLSVSVRSPAARRVYERVGFVAWGIEPGCLCVEGEFIDEVHMVCML
jgi:RimJ/RimL family protein N-acetyltransferase